MLFSRGGARNWVHVPALVRAMHFPRPRIPRTSLRIARFFILMTSPAIFASPACPQDDSGSTANEFHGKGSEITVTVHDSSGQPISAAAMVKVYRDGTTLSRQGETSRGSAVLVVNLLGEYTITVEAPGYEEVQKQVSVQVTGRTQVDVYLRQISAGSAPGIPGRPLLAPKAKEALEKGLLALGADKLGEAEKFAAEAMRLAPSHPDVLYVQGVVWLKERKWTQAQDALEKATQIDPNHAQAFAALGMALCDQDKYREAIQPLEKSLQLDAASAWETRWALAKAYYHNERYDEALKMSQDALAASNGKAPEIALLVAQSLTAVGRYEDAAQMLRAFLKGHSDRPEAPTAQRWLERLAASAKIQPNPN